MREDRYTEQRLRNRLASSAFGILLSLGVNCAVIFGSSFNGLKYIYPPPEEKALLLDFEEIPEVENQEEVVAPQAEEIVEAQTPQLVQQAETPDNVEEEAIDTRALFRVSKSPAADSTAEKKTEDKVAEALREGKEDGNAAAGLMEGTPSANLKGRKVVGQLAKPKYEVQESGTVVVEIWVDQQGGVAKAIPGAAGSTTSDMNLWKAARQAALRTTFNIDYDAPGLQQGTITYIFDLQ